MEDISVRINSLPIAPANEAEEIIERAIKTLRITITGRCNLFCPFCYAEGIGLTEVGTPLSTKEALNTIGGHMDFDFAKSIILGAADAGFTGIIFTGGEPLLHPNIFELSSIINELGMSVSITTNGVFLDRLVLSDWAQLPNKEFHVSVHTIKEEDYDEIHGVKNKGSRFLPRVLNGLNLLRNHSIKFNLNMVIESIEQFEYNWGVIELARKINAPVKVLGSHDNPNGIHITSKQIQAFLEGKGYKRKKQFSTTKINYGYTPFEVDGTEVRVLNFLYGSKCETCPIGGCGEGIRYMRIFPSGQISPCLGISTPEENYIRTKDTFDLISTKLGFARGALIEIASEPRKLDKLI